MSSKVQVPYPFFSDIDGRPLNAGYIYIGEEGKNPEVYPINVFWDEDLTVPADQPLRTRNGYISKNGRAGKVYIADSGCSITVKNKDALISYTDLRSDTIFGQKNLISSTDSIESLNSEKKWEDKIVYVKDIGFFKCISNVWKPVYSPYTRYSNYNFIRPYLGYNPSNDAAIYNDQQSYADQSLLMNGSMHFAKKYRGLRRHADVLGVRGGMSTVANGNEFNDQIVGVANARELANYGMNDGVTLFADASLPALESWEDIGTATYTSNTVIINTSTYATTLAKLKVGDVIQTKHATKCWGIVTAINVGTGTITVDEWATNLTTVVTPANNVGFYINFINKAWAVNFNLMINEDSAGVGGVVAELGLQVKKSDATVKNGMDMVLLPGSTTNGDAAFLSRGTSTYSWTYGYLSQGNLFNYYSSSGVRQPLAGFAENSNAVCGVKFFNKNTYSMLWSTNADQSSISISTSPTIFGPNGTLLRQPKSLQVLSASGGASEVKTTYLLSAAGISVTLPPKAQHVAGHWYEFVLINTGTYTFLGNDALINGNATYTFTVTDTYVKYTMVYDGNGWIMYKG